MEKLSDPAYSFVVLQQGTKVGLQTNLRYSLLSPFNLSTKKAQFNNRIYFDLGLPLTDALMLICMEPN